ncbi:MAG: phasin family protein [Rhizobiaceae bacterium]
MTKKQSEKIEVSPTMEKSQEYFTTQIANTEKAVESMIEFNAAVFKGGEAVAKKAYENYVANVAAAFDGVKSLNKTNDVAEFYKVSTANTAAAAERMSEQGKGLVELSGKVMKETGEAGRLAYSKGFAVNM